MSKSGHLILLNMVFYSGLGECQLSLAKSLMQDCRDGGAIDLIQQAIQNLFR